MISAYSIFCESFADEMDGDKTSESVMDYPNGDGLCPDIWEKDGDGWKMKDAISEKVLEISRAISVKLGLDGVKTVVVGSICTNTYDEDSDVDVHLEVDGLAGEDEKSMKRLNKKAREAFADKFGDTEFGGHPVEVYVQNNKFQDLGSRGAYDVSSGKWVSGPTIASDDFDPYDEYFEKALDEIEESGSVASAGKAVFDALILADAMLRMRGEKSVKKAYDRLQKVSADAKAAFDGIRADRKSSSTPKSRKDSERMRKDKEWNVRDAAFKIMGDVGLIAILKDLTNVKDAEGDEKDKAKFVVDSIKDSLFKE